MSKEQIVFSIILAIVFDYLNRKRSAQYATTDKVEAIRKTLENVDSNIVNRINQLEQSSFL